MEIVRELSDILFLSSVLSPVPGLLSLFLMAPKVGAVDLAKFTPTPEEMQAARTILNSSDEKRKRSGMAAMTQFLKRNPCDSTDMISASRGNERLDYLARYLAYQQRKSKGTTTSASIAFQDDIAHADYMFWSEYEIKKQVGEEKAHAWISSGKLTYKPDRVTGLDTPALREYRVPVLWLRTTEGKRDSICVKNDSETAQGDLGNVTSLAPSASRAKGELEELKVKAEPRSEEEILKDKVSTFRKEAGINLRRLQDIRLNIAKVSAQTQTSKYTEALATDAKKIELKNAKLVKALERLAVNPDDVKDEEVPTLMKAVDQHFNEAAKIFEWGEKLGIEMTYTKKKRQRKAS